MKLLQLVKYLTFPLCLLLLFAQVAAQRVGWRGIVPLHSTKADVARLLGKYAVKVGDSQYFITENEIAVIQFQTVSCSSTMGKFGFGWNVPADVVTIIGIVPKQAIRKEAVGVTDDFKLEKAGSGFTYYDSSDEGISVETLDGIVTSINYQPSNKDGKKCEVIEKCCWDFFPTLDEFGRLPRTDEAGRIRLFLDQLKFELMRGVIVVSGPSSGERTKEMNRLSGLIKPLLRMHRIEAQRVLIVDGGYRETRNIKLNEYPIASEVHRIYLFPDEDPKPIPQKR